VRGVKRHLILVGLSGAGKSTVGRLAAAGLKTRVHDVDATIERELGISIKEIFSSRGEAEFRELEQGEIATALAGDPIVIVPGGGWAAQPGNLESVVGRSVTVYLEVSPETALGRISDGATRPLLAVADPAGKLDELFAVRRPYYEKCDHTISTEGKTPEQVAREVTELALESEGQ